MNFRQISIIIGILFLIGAGFLTYRMIQSGEASEEAKRPQQARAVQTRNIQNTRNPVVVAVSGKLEASKRIEIYAEVQGRFISSAKTYKEGVFFKEGEVLVQIDKEEAAYNLRSQKSDLKNSITQMLPDLKIDHPKHFDRWKTYLESMKLSEPLKPLPAVDKGQVDYFISARNIYSLYNTIKAQEERLSDFTIRAPFNGILTEAMIDPGTLVRPGQKLGEFIHPEGYELQAPIGANEFGMIETEDSVILHSNDIKGEWQGTVKRLNNKINPGTQTAQVTIATEGDQLKEGMYLQGKVFTGQVPNSAKVPRRFVEDGKLVWIIKDGTLQQKQVELRHSSGGMAIIQGLEDGTIMLNEAIPTAYEGMPVKPVKESAI